jgi:autotransporter-associated beta strand protein
VGNNFGLGEVPNLDTVGYVTNDTANSRIVLVLNNGPKPLTWTGTNASFPTFWDNDTTINWLAFKGTVNEAPSTFNKADFALFDDTGSSALVQLMSEVEPGGVAVNNSSVNYEFAGSGRIAGLGGLLKQGTGSLFLNNSGVSTFIGGVNVAEGSVTFGRDNAISGGTTVASGATAQVGTNGNSGNLPAGIVNAEGSLIFNRGSTAYTVANKIGGNGSITKNDLGVLTLSGPNNTFTGAVAVASGTLRAGSGTALGTADGTTTIASGASLDVNGFQLNGEPVVVGGAGVTNNGALINSGADQINALGNVTLSGHTTFGGSGRWDIRGGLALLNTGGNAYDVTKVGNNQVTLVGVSVDAALGNITVSNGMFSVETTTTSLGNPASTLTVYTNGTFQMFNVANAMDKVIVLHGNGLTNTVSVASGTANTLQGSITLNGATRFNFTGNFDLTLNGAIGGGGSLTRFGVGSLIMNGNASYPGNTVVNGGTFVLNSINSGGGTLTNAIGTTITGHGTNTGPVRVHGNFQPGGLAGVAGPFGAGALTLSNANVTFDLGTNDYNSIFPANDVVYSSGALTLQRTNVFTLSAGPIGALTVGQVITLIHYNGALTGGATNIQIVGGTGYSYTLIDPSTTPNQIRVQVTKAPLNVVWRGGNVLNATAWDVNITTNWVNAADNVTPVTFTNFDGVQFTDTQNSTTVNLVGTLQPNNIAATHGSVSYTFGGTGKLSGAMPLNLTGGGLLTIANSGVNDFTGPITIAAGVLQVGNGGTAGNLGSGVITNNGGLAFFRSDALTVNNAIAGGGSLTNLGTGITTLGANTFDGEVFVAQGTIRASAGSSLGSIVSGTTIASGASLDVNAQTLNAETVNVSGSGVTNGGAIVNSGAQSLNAMGNVNLLGHTVFGGTGRWDIRGGAATLSTGGNPFNITKVGANQVSLVGVAVDPALADVTVQAGTFSLETTTTSIGNPVNNFTVAAGATLQMFQSTTAWDKNFLLNGNGVANTINVADGAFNTINGPITLTGPCIFSVNGGDALTIAGNIGGSGSLTKAGGGNLTLSGTLSYAGNFSVNAGSVGATGASLLTNSPVINLATGTLLDVTGLPGSTLVLISGQLLTGNGTINGGLTVGGGAAVAPGASPGILTVTNEVVLAGTTFMEINRLAGTNDLLRSISGSITYGGSLVVTNLAGTIKGGDVFKLFDSGLNSYLSSFSAIQMPGLGVGLSWNTSQLAVNGTVSVVGTLIPPAIDSFGQSGGNLTIAGDGGVTNGTYWLVSSTNVAAAIATWLPVSTNSFDGNGNFSVTTPIAPGTPARFFRVRLP